MRILVADDNREIRSALHLVLTEVCPGVTIEEAGDGETARELLRRYPLDLVLYDWDLPGLDAARFAADATEVSPCCEVIAMSGRPEARREALLAGAGYFVGTNDPPSRLVGLLRLLLTANDTRR